MNELRALLSFMSDGDRAKVLHHYERMFNEAGEEGERDVIRLLGSPVRQVLQVERDYREREEQGLPGVSDVYDEPESFLSVPSEPLPKEPEPAEAKQFEVEDAPNAGQPEPFSAIAANDWAEEKPLVSFEEDAEARRDSGNEQILSADIPVCFAPDDGGENESAETESEEESYVAEALKAAFAACSAEEEPDESVAEPAAETVTEERPGSGRVTLAVVLSPFIVVLALLGVALTLALSLIGLVPGTCAAVGSVYFIGYAVLGMTYIPDMLMILGVGVACLGVAILLLWFGIWIVVEGISLVIRLISRIYNAILQKEGTKA